MENKEELKTLVAYLIKHNQSHVEELEGLACQLKETDPEAYKDIQESIKAYKEGNEKLASSLRKIS